MIRILLCGAAGRMGRALIEAIRDADDLTLHAAIERPEHPRLGEVVERTPEGTPVRLTADWPSAPPADAVVLDFSAPEAAAAAAEWAAEQLVPLVTGTTGWTEDQLQRIEQLAATIPILRAPNMAVGVNILFHLLQRLHEVLPPEFDLEVLEAHHRNKVDAHSGTARRILEILAERGAPVHGREGHTGPRPPEQIGVHALRLGGIIGEHTVRACSPSEELIITHRALDRSLFAKGALRACRFILGRPPGLYSMRQVLGL